MTPDEMRNAEDEALVRAELSEPDTADYGLITDYLAGELSPEDRERVEERLRADPKFRALAEPLIMMMWELSPEVDRAADERSVQEFRARLELEELDSYAPTKKKAAKRRRRRRTIFAIIATVIGAGLYEWLRPQWMPAPVPSLMVHADAPEYAARSESLPDESQVTLIAGSHLSYSRGFSRFDERKLTLDGEGTFTVAPGVHAPLVVVGTGVEVTAYRGRFTVQAYDGISHAYVKVQEGQVAVRARTAAGYSDALTLNSGQGVRVGPGQQIERVDPPIAPASRKSQSTEATPENASRPDLFVRGTTELARRGSAIGDSIERDFGERPHEIAFTGTDTIDVTFWNPTFWRSDMHSKEFPQASLPAVRRTAEQVGGFIWSRYGREAGINVIRVTFIRMRRVNTKLLTRDVPVQELTGLLTRKQLETGPPQLISLTMTQR